MFSFKLQYYFLLLVFALGFMSACTPYKLVEEIPEGTHRKRILFRSEPTSSEIFINDIFLGRTPIKTDIWYIGDRTINVKAQPLYPSQYPQNILVKVPRVPAKMTIFMDYNPMAGFEMKKKEGRLGAAGEAGAGELGAFDMLSLKDTIVIKEPVALPIIYFDYDEYYIPDNEKDKLYVLVDLMIKNPLLKLSIHGHADERGTPEYNKVLSTNRALSIFNYLVECDIEPERLRVYGHGVVNIVELDGYRLEYQNDRIVTFRLYWNEFEEPSMDD
jgi:outer membrane protein OmpA-like peptidoglycan-associated protein